MIFEPKQDISNGIMMLNPDMEKIASMQPLLADIF